LGWHGEGYEIGIDEAFFVRHGECAGRAEQSLEGKLRVVTKRFFGLKALNCAGRLLLDQDFPGLPQP
jgi:hypothetical protein